VKALFFDEKLIFLNDYPAPAPTPGESLIRVLMAGICNTDIEIMKGYMEFKGVLGHEFVGIVEKSGKKELVGKRVVGDINCPCGKCPLCQDGLGKHCPNRTTLGIQERDGAFAEYLVLPDENLIPVPDNVEDVEAVFVEPLAAAFEIIESVHIKPTDRVLLLGDGKLGLLCSQVIAGTGCSLLVAGKHPQKLKILEDLGIPTISPGDVEKREKFNVVVECTGRPGGFELARKMIRPGGTIIQKSTYAQDINVNISMLVVDEIRLVGSRCGPFRPAMSALERKTIKVKPLVSTTYPLNDVLLAFDAAMERDALKILVTIR